MTQHAEQPRERVITPAITSVKLAGGGCKIGREPNKLPFDLSQLMTVWTLSSWFSAGVLILWFGAWAARRIALSALLNFTEIRQARALQRYHWQFAHCDFEIIQLDNLIPEPVQRLLASLPGNLKRKKPFEVFSVKARGENKISPGAFTTFYFARQPSIVFCPVSASEMTPYQKFILFHELAHATGIQTSHRVAPTAILIDVMFVLLLIISAGMAAAWGWWLVAGYVVLRMLEAFLFTSTDDGTGTPTEVFADSVGYWGITATDGQGAVDRVRRIRAKQLAGSERTDLGREKLSKVLAEMEAQELQAQARHEEHLASLRRQEESKGEFSVEHRYQMGVHDTEVLFLHGIGVDQVDPSNMWKSSALFAILLACTATIIAIGVQLRPITIGMALIVACALSA